MRAIVLLLATALCCGSVSAALPHEINYQGYLTNPGGTPVNTTVSMVFSLYDDPALSGPHQLYTEMQSVPVVNGVFNVLIGPQKAAQFSLLAFDVPYWLGVAVAPDTEMTPRQPVAASAYAIRSASTESLAATATVPAAQVTGAVGSAGTATKLATARAINGVAFDGTADITLPAAVTIASKYGPVAGSVALSTSWVFVGPTVTVTVTGSQKITANSVISLGASSGGRFGIDICYRNTTSSVISSGSFLFSQLVPNVLTTISPTRSAAPGAGSYEVGVCVAASGNMTLNNNDVGWIWAMVTN